MKNRRQSENLYVRVLAAAADLTDEGIPFTLDTVSERLGLRKPHLRTRPAWECARSASREAPHRWRAATEHARRTIAP